MLEIVVHAPIKTDDRYEFSYSTRWRRSLAARVRRPRRAPDLPTAGTYRFGFRALNHVIPHHEVWDGFYPLFYLTRNGGPLFRVGPQRARIRFEYPIPSVVRDFFTERAGDFGHRIEVAGATTSVRFDGPVGGDVIAFGGGKDSRLALGAMREIGLEPVVHSSGAENTLGVDGALTTEPMTGLPGVLADRVMPAFMALGGALYLGTTLGEVHHTMPWQQTYDICAPSALAGMSRLFRALGAPMRLHAPVNVLPYSLIQRILSDRYPHLAAGQVSVPSGSGKEKNLHVSLLKIATGLPFEEHCSEPRFRKLLSKFVRRQTKRPHKFGYRDSRETVNREMRAIIWRHRAEPLFEAVRDDVPADWDGPWIDYIHDYVSPQLDERFLRIYREYARTVDEAPADIGIRRVRTER